MTYTGYGRVTKGVGGLFTVRLFNNGSRLHSESSTPMPLDGHTVFARGRGVLHKKGALLVGDLVEVSYDRTSFVEESGTVVPSPDGSGISIDRVCDRTCALIRPPMANLDILFVTLAAASPDPVLETVDKLISIAEFNHIEPVIVITKSDLAPAYAEELEKLYRNAGFDAFRAGFDTEDEKRALKEYINRIPDGKIAAFSGASGVGKSTMLNTLFPALNLETGEISHRIERGKNTTRCVELYPLSDKPDCSFLADTPGFTMLDFERFDFFEKDDLPLTFREFVPLIGFCRYTKCSHTKEQGCAIIDAVREGSIAPSRHQSFVALYDILKKKTKW
ncbi:MAG: ribosome small subunit-dependent GTPase A [Clostridia bacterium]|nr:ribosome small subunit-dependent GTPase A [Clostridia bacterium]